MKLRAVFADNLRRRRRDAGLSQEELAHRADIDRTYVSMLERQEYAVSLDVIERLADALGAQPYEMLIGVEGRAPADAS
jgi:transcriptional regulator with XRE-family HTH domain